MAPIKPILEEFGQAIIHLTQMRNALESGHEMLAHHYLDQFEHHVCLMMDRRPSELNFYQVQWLRDSVDRITYSVESTLLQTVSLCATRLLAAMNESKNSV
jgi:hypothetical protein